MSRSKRHALDLRHIETFLHVCRLGSISAAAKGLGLGQASLSEAMTALERNCGQKLFLRGRRGVILTEAGAFLKQEGEALLQAAAVLQQKLTGFSSAAGHVSLAMSPSVSVLAGLDLVETMNSEHPAIRLHMTESLSSHTIDRLLRGQLDLGVVYDIADHPELDLSPLFQEQMFLISAPDFTNAQSEIAPQDMNDWHFVLPSSIQPFRRSLDTQLRQLGVQPSGISELDSHSQIIAMLSRASACSILPKSPVLKELAEGSLIATPIAGTTFLRHCYIARPRNRIVSAASLEVERIICKILQEASRRYGLQMVFG